MSDDEYREMAATLHSVEGMVVLSGYACDLYDKELFADWSRFEKATVADGARPRVEVLWLNRAAYAALNSQKAQRSMFGEAGYRLD